MQESRQSPESSRGTRHPIILVHGTWGRGFFPKRLPEGCCEDPPTKTAADSSTAGRKRWFENGSEFRGALEQRLESLSLECSFWQFRWSGENSVFARDRAATKLADELKPHLQDQAASPIVIAHSHGGNVALRALSRVGDANRVRVVTLATPFLRVFVRDPPKPDFLVWLLLWAAVAVTIAVPAVLIVLAILSAVGGLAANRMNDGLILGVLLAGMAAAALAAIIVLCRTNRFLFNPQSNARGSIAQDIQQAAFFPPISTSGPQMLVIRGVDDEASLTLAAGSIGSRLSSVVLFSVIPAVYLLGSVLLAILSWSGVWPDRAEALIIVVVYGCAFTALVCLLLPGICKSVFGREFLTTAFICETAADSAPDTSATIDSVTLSPAEAGRRLRHCIYEHPKCVDEIVRWIHAAATGPGQARKNAG